MHPLASAGILFGGGLIIVIVCAFAINDLKDYPRNAKRIKFWRGIQLFGAVQMLPLLILLWVATILG